MRHKTDQMLDINGARLHVAEAGEGPVIVLLAVFEGARQFDVPDAAHLPSLERTGPCNAAVRAFLVERYTSWSMICPHSVSHISKVCVGLRSLLRPSWQTSVET